jgi:phenylacetate-coenzyme A ligase PaaK-like adenylate-forming protein
MSTTSDEAHKPHYWQGEWVDDAGLAQRLPGLRGAVEQAMAAGLPTAVVLGAAARLAARLRTDKALVETLIDGFEAGPSRDAARDGLGEVSVFLGRGSLEDKLVRELGDVDPFTAKRPRFRDPVFERWAPLGLLVHVAPGNDFAVGALSVVEGLLSGNVNVLKTSSSDTTFPQKFLAALAAEDASGRLARHVIVAKIPSRDKQLLGAVLDEAAGVAAWGGEDAIASLRKLAPASARFVDWGHRLSFAYVAASKLEDSEAMERIAIDVCRMEQQACASPQCIYLETSDQTAVESYGKKFADALGRVSAALPAPELDDHESAEISMVTAVASCEAALGLGSVHEPKDRSWRVLVDSRSSLRASPLYRSIWVKPLPRTQIFPTLWPMRQYLQTAGLACSAAEVETLSAKLVASGILRVTEAGAMLGSYSGEPHDGVYALQRYTRRVSFQLPTIGNAVTSFAELARPDVVLPWDAKAKPAVMGKAEFQALWDEQDPAQSPHADLYFKSGGSSGDPKISIFSYPDYHMQMQLAAEGLFAAGLDPARDRCMNLFFGGGLYGGFLSFFTILEHMRAVQFPMAAHLDFSFVMDMILRFQVDTILGMPSYVIQLFTDPANVERLKKHRPVKKIFYGGEHFNAAQRAHLQRDFGVELIRSATYGSVDAGPLGYQCVRSEGGVHHLHHRLQHLEILALDSDAPAAKGQAGRMVFTSLARRGQAIHRYDIGDLGRWVEGDCACGRLAPRFELLGRHGDVFRAAGSFLNYALIARLLGDLMGYGGEVQLVIDRAPRDRSGGGVPQDRLRVLVDEALKGKEIAAAKALTGAYHDLEDLVVNEGTLLFSVECQAPQTFARTAGSGKLVHVVDQREEAKRR